jgi:hypothetical protein
MMACRAAELSERTVKFSVSNPIAKPGAQRRAGLMPRHNPVCPVASSPAASCGRMSRLLRRSCAADQLALSGVFSTTAESEGNSLHRFELCCMLGLHEQLPSVLSPAFAEALRETELAEGSQDGPDAKAFDHFRAYISFSGPAGSLHAPQGVRGIAREGVARRIFAVARRMPMCR